MKQFLLICQLSFLAFSAQAQVQWFQPSDNWDFHIYTGWTGAGLEHCSVGTQTTINGRAYTTIKRDVQYSNGAGHYDVRYVRQDGDKVYALMTDFSQPSGYSEFLMYDFSLAVNDSIMLPLYGVTTNNYGYKVTAVGVVQVNGQPRRSQSVTWKRGNSLTSAITGAFIEGIGYVVGYKIIGAAPCLTDNYFFLDEPSALAVDGSQRHLCSFTQPGGTYEALGVGFCVSVATSEPTAAEIQVYPNPSNGTLHISPIADAKYRLYDLNGRALAFSMTDDATLRSDYKGICVLEIALKGGALERRMVVFE